MNAPGEPNLARIPSMTALLKSADSFDGLRGAPRGPVSTALRQALDELRGAARQGDAGDSAYTPEAVLSRAVEIIHASRTNRLTRVINATGVVLHTGLGRSVLPQAAIERVRDVASGYCSLEIDLDSGKRGRRGGYVEELLVQLIGAEAALVVNNNAAATMLALRALARDREVIVSRGQLIEIGGSYRLPEVMEGGGACLREVGTTNKTHLRDYENAICDRTAMIMHVHTSNYRVVGFSECPGASELAELAHRHDLLMFDDLGSGAFLAHPVWAAAKEPTVVDSLGRGSDLVSFSGDKLLGGPQAGILLGRTEIIDRLRRDPTARALRIDKLAVGALEAVLELYQSPETAVEHIPLLASLVEEASSLASRASDLRGRLSEALPDEAFTVKEDESFAGGGSLPAWPFPTSVVCWRPSAGSVDVLARKLRLRDPSVLCRIKDDAIHLDLRTIREHEYDEIAAALTAVRA